MSRKSIIWIVIGVLGAAALAAVAVVFYHLGFDHGSSGGVVRLRMPMGGNGSAVGFSRRFGGAGGFPGLALLLGVLVAGGIGALIVYLVSAGRPAAAAGSAPTPSSTLTPGGGPHDPQWQQFEQWQQWQQFEQWRRAPHGAVIPEPAAPSRPLTETAPHNAPTPGAGTPPPDTLAPRSGSGQD